jgi:D-alanyl-lipoteichoic acid acyltransferase DltB (MBOAT superfamily)
MLFNSYAFVFAFLPLFIAGFYTVSYLMHQKPACVQNAVELYCVILSFIFFAFFGIKVLGVLVLSLVWNGIVLYLLRSASNSKPLLIAGICGNVAMLLFFKYAGFFAEIINAFSGSTITASILLPIAISFYTFSQISLLVDVYRGEVTELSIVDYLAYITFFPKILQGPIVRYNDMKDQFIKGAEHKWDTESFMQAVMLFVLGLSKKVIIADTLAIAVDYGYGSLNTLTPMDAILTAICYSFQIYFDFSGYCDMGRGICKMVGMDLPVNFESPYKARNIDDFWKRWHMSLTAFFTRYVYIPLGGNRKGKVRTYINFMIIFILSGFWHGAGLTFIVWGAMHGLLYVVTRAISGKNKAASKTIASAQVADIKSNIKANKDTAEKAKAKKLIPYPIALILTFIFVSIAWVFFRAETVKDAVTLISAMTRFKDYGAAALMISPDFIKCFQIDELWYIFKITPIAHMPWGPKVCMWLIILISAVFAFVTPNAAKLTEKHKVNVPGAIMLAVLLVWSIIKFANVSTYIYLGF